MLHGSIEDQPSVLVSAHRQCRFGDVFGATACRCRERLDRALRWVGQRGGVILHFSSEPGVRCAGAESVWSAPPIWWMTPRILKDLGVRRALLLADEPVDMPKGPVDIEWEIPGGDSPSAATGATQTRPLLRTLAAARNAFPDPADGSGSPAGDGHLFDVESAAGGG